MLARPSRVRALAIVLVLAAPFAYAIRPRGLTLAVTMIGLLVWCRTLVV